jgi:hypothetical protein
MAPAKEQAMSNEPRPGRRVPTLVGLALVAIAALVIAVSRRPNGNKADRTGHRTQEAAELVGETAADLARGPGHG